MKRAWLILPALALALLMSACQKGGLLPEKPDPTPSVQIVYVTVTPEPTPFPAETPAETAETGLRPAAGEAAPQGAELPLVTDPQPGDFPGGLDDDGPGPEEELAPYGGGTKEGSSMTAEQQYEANIFLSNFAEQGFRFYMYDRDLGDLLGSVVDFVRTWCKINDRGAISYSQLDGATYEVLTLDKVNAVASRYFPLSVTRESVEDYFLPQEHRFYQDGYFFFDAADGEAYNRIAVADSITPWSDGMYLITFMEFDIDLDTYFSFDDGIPGSYYRLSTAEAIARSDLHPAASGSAVVIPNDHNGRATYQLFEYSVW